MKKILLIIFTFISVTSFAQQIDSIFVHLYTDSLKKGTFNYINIDGLLSNKRYLPLDSTQIIFWASDGNFTGNNLWVSPDFDKDKITIKATLRKNEAVYKEFDIYIKKIPNPITLKTEDEILNKISKPKRRN